MSIIKEKIMKIGVMQPYFIPYIGYWQLMNYVDKYVIFDDVNYINRGWIDRNRILINKQVQYIGLPVVGKSQNKLINEINVNSDKKLIEKVIKTVELNYKKSIYFEEVFPLFCEIMRNDEKNLALFLKDSILQIANYLDITTEFILSSDIEKDNSLKGQDKILQICKKLNGTEYINAIGGQELYSKELFSDNGLKLSFLKTSSIEYNQTSSTFEPNLSIIDVLMNCSKEEIKEFLNKFELL